MGGTIGHETLFPLKSIAGSAPGPGLGKVSPLLDDWIFAAHPDPDNIGASGFAAGGARPYHNPAYQLPPRRFELPENLNEKQGFPADPAQKAAQNGIGNGIICQEAGGCQQSTVENSLADVPWITCQNSTGLDTDKLAEMLRMIPAEKRAEFLRSLADYIDNNRKPSK